MIHPEFEFIGKLIKKSFPNFMARDGSYAKKGEC